MIKEQFDVLTDQGVIKRFGTQFYDKENGLPPKGYQLPKEYGLITNETDKPLLEFNPELVKNNATQSNLLADKKPVNKNREQQVSMPEGTAKRPSKGKPRHKK